MNEHQDREELTALLHERRSPRRPGDPPPDRIERWEGGDAKDPIVRLEEDPECNEKRFREDPEYQGRPEVQAKMAKLIALREARSRKTPEPAVDPNAPPLEQLKHPRTGQSYYTRHREGLRREERRAEIRTRIDELEIEMRRLDEEPAAD